MLKDSIYETTANALKMSTFGAIDITGWFKNGNAEKVQKAIDKLSDRNKDLQQSLEDLNDTIKNTSGAKSVEAYKDSYSLQEEQNDNYKKIAQAQASYHGGHHSWDYYWNGFTEAQTEWIKKHVKENFNGDIWSLTPEEMKKLRGNVDIWDYIKNTGKGGYGERLTGKLDDYINQAGKLEELTDAINESLTQVSFSSMRNDFISNLMDMSKSAKDFSNDFATMMQKSMLQYSLSDILDTDLKGLYEKWGAKMQEGTMSKDDIDELKKEYDALVEKGMEVRDNISQITGYKDAQSEQTATGKAIEAITVDQASSLIGIGYAVQIAVEQGNDTRAAIAVDVSAMRETSQNIADNISEMRDIQYQGLEQLQAINKNTNNLFQIKDDMSELKKIAKDFWR